MPFLGTSVLLYSLASAMRMSHGRCCSIEIPSALFFQASLLEAVARSDPDSNNAMQHYFGPVTSPIQSISREVLLRQWMSNPKARIAQAYSKSLWAKLCGLYGHRLKMNLC